MKAIKVALTILAVMLAAACSQNDGSEPAGAANEGPALDSTASQTANEPAMAGTQSENDKTVAAVLKVAMSDKYGPYLVDKSGRALYTIVNEESPDNDVAQGSEGQNIKAEVVPCDEACLQIWPPYLTQGEPVAKEKVDPSLIHTLDRPDGSTQVLYSGYTLFYYVKDQQAGDTLGQGVKGFGGTWYLVAPGGEEIKEPAGGATK